MSTLATPGSSIGPYTVIRFIARGSFAEVYLVKDSATGFQCAIKLESESGRAKSLNIEQTILTAVQPSPFFPRLFSTGLHGSLGFMAMEILGPSLSAVQRILPNHSFSLPTTLRLAREMLQALATFHSRGYVNRDVKPDNFLLRGTIAHPLVLVDYGLARLHIDPETGSPFPAREQCQFCGTIPFASVTTHLRGDLARRDDLWSWLYCVVDLAAGELPWGHEKNKEAVCEAKRNMEMGTLCARLPPEFVQIGEGIARLKYEEKPDYEAIERLLNEAIARSAVLEGDEYDWERLANSVWDEISVVPREKRRASETGNEGCCIVQ